MACADMCLRYAPATEVEAWGNRAEAEARAALAADDGLAEAHLARAAVARKREFDWDATLDASDRALVLDPNLDQAHFFKAAAYYHLGYMEEALIELEKGRRLHGADVVEPMRIEALVALFSGQFAPARARLEEVSRLSSRAIGDTYLALAYHYSGNSERARTMLESLATQSSASTAARASIALAGVLAAQHDHDAARRQVDQVLSRPYRDHHVVYGLGAAYAQLGDTHGRSTGCASPPTPGSHACRGSSATPGSSRSAVSRPTRSSSPTFERGATPRSRPIAADGRPHARHPCLATRRLCWYDRR